MTMSPATHPPAVKTAGRVGAGWITLLSVASLGLWMAYFGPLQVLLPDQIEHIAGDRKTAAAAWDDGNVPFSADPNDRGDFFGVGWKDDDVGGTAALERVRPVVEA